MTRFRIIGRGSTQGVPAIPAPSHWQCRTRPFFRTLHSLLQKEGETTLGHLLDAAREQTYGLLILILSLPSLVPGINIGAAPVGGLAIMAIGAQLALGVPRPSIPESLRRQRLHKGRIKDALAKFERILERTRLRNRQRKPLPQRWLGLVVFWTAILLAMPVPLPFGNIFPALTLCLLGAALLEERAAWAWTGVLGSLGITIYFALSFNLILRTTAKALAAAHHWIA